MNDETRIIQLAPIPPRAEAKEEWLRQIRTDATLTERMDAWRTYLRRAA